MKLIILLMPISPARMAAYRILRRVESGNGFAVELLEREEVSRLEEADRRLATELVMGVLRARGDLDYWLENLSGKPLKYFDPEVAAVLRLGIYQLRYLERIPKSAAVNESVELTKFARKGSAAGLVNAVLRKCEPRSRSPARGRRAKVDPEATRSAVRSLPVWLASRWERNFGREAMESLARVSFAPPASVLRVPGNAAREEYQRQLAEVSVTTRPGRYAPCALVVERGSFHSLSAQLKQRLVIQDEASQLAGELVRPRPGDRILDLCAAPGIKAGQLAQALGQGFLVACDLSARRLHTMARLLPGFVPPGVHLEFVRLDASRELPFAVKFDRVLVDVPCSGTGTLARNPEIKWRLNPQDLPRLAAIETRILARALQVLAPRGRLVYATCSLEPEENEQVLGNVLTGQKGVALLSPAQLQREFPALSSLFDSRGYFRTRPDLDSMDGFFAAVILRAG